VRFALSVAIVAGLLAGCQAVATKPSPPVDIAAAQAAQQAREAALGLAKGDCAAPNWAMTGRVALSNGRDGGSGRIEWLQGDGRLQVSLSAPVTRQSWVLAVDAGAATLDGVPNGPLRGPDAGALLRDATGWDIPVAALGCWVRGARAGVAFGTAEIAYDAGARPSRVTQGGWTIDYAEWKLDPASGLPMTGWINAQLGENRVRLRVDRWGALVE
jgi:outer membrane lipoprotein LolB